LKQGDLIAEKYKIIRPLGKGGMGKVYLAEHVLLRKEYAIKFLNPFLLDSEEIRGKFIQEARIGATLDHPNIVKVIDISIKAGMCFIVMEYIDGSDLSEMMERRRFTEDEIYYIAEQILSALDYAHSRGLIHRDIKPSNIMLTREGKAYLTDFGIAKALSSAGLSQKKSQTILTPEFAAPEQSSQTRFGRVSPRTDIYSLGITLFCLACGKPPFTGDTGDIILKHMEEPLPDLKKLNPSLSNRFCSIIERAVRKRQEERYQSAKEMAGAIKAKETVIEKPPIKVKYRKAVVPDLKGFTYERAKRELESAGLKVRAEYSDVRDERSDGRVMSQYPHSGSEIDFASGVTIKVGRYEGVEVERPKRRGALRWVLAIIIPIVVGLIVYGIMGGGKKTEIPDMVGISEKEAVNIIEKSGLKYRVEKKETDVDDEVGSVIGQSPISGRYTESEFPPGSEVILTVGERKEEIVVPTLIGMKEDEAVRILNKIDLSSKITYKEAKSSSVDKVIEQSPSAGVKVDPSSYVYLVVGVKSKETGSYITPKVPEVKKEYTPKKEETKGIVCPRCGYRNRPDASICAKCGAELPK